MTWIEDLAHRADAVLPDYVAAYYHSSAGDGSCDREGIADYFSTPLQVAMQGGSGAGNSSSVINGGGTDLTRSSGSAARSDAEAGQRRMTLQAMQAEVSRADQERMRTRKGRVEQVLMNNAKLAEFRSQIKIDITPDGLRIQIVDEQSRPMFDTGSAVVKDYMREILRAIGRVLNDVDNRISLSGHTDSSLYGGGERGYSNWELSADRANASRRELIAGGMDERKVARVLGLASSVPYDAS